MSWSTNVPATSKDEFDAAVDAAVPSPGMTTDAGKAQFQAAQAAAKSLAAQFNGVFPIAVRFSGHTCQEMPGSSPYDTISVYVAEQQPPVSAEVPDEAETSADEEPAEEAVAA